MTKNVVSACLSGGRIILACRDEKKALKARKDIILQSGNTDIHFRHLDLASLKSVRSFAERINSGRFFYAKDISLYTSSYNLVVVLYC